MSTLTNIIDSVVRNTELEPSEKQAVYHGLKKTQLSAIMEDAHALGNRAARLSDPDRYVDFEDPEDIDLGTLEAEFIEAMNKCLDSINDYAYLTNHSEALFKG